MSQNIANEPVNTDTDESYEGPSDVDSDTESNADSLLVNYPGSVVGPNSDDEDTMKEEPMEKGAATFPSTFELLSHGYQCFAMINLVMEKPTEENISLAREFINVIPPEFQDSLRKDFAQILGNDFDLTDKKGNVEKEKDLSQEKEHLKQKLDELIENIDNKKLRGKRVKELRDLKKYADDLDAVNEQLQREIDALTNKNKK